MKTYSVVLTRGYLVEIEANSEQEAKFFAEYYVGGNEDLSTQNDRNERKFKINDIEMTVNDAISIEETELEPAGN